MFGHVCDHSRCNDHSRCDAMIMQLRTQLADIQKLLESERQENRAREWELTKVVVNNTRPAPPPLVQRSPQEMIRVTEDLPPELFDPENALYLGPDVTPEGWIPKHLRVPAEPEPAK